MSGQPIIEFTLQDHYCAQSGSVAVAIPKGVGNNLTQPRLFFFMGPKPIDPTKFINQKTDQVPGIIWRDMDYNLDTLVDQAWDDLKPVLQFIITKWRLLESCKNSFLFGLIFHHWHLHCK